MITIIQHDINEWSRMAAKANADGHASIGARYSAAAAIPAFARITPAAFEDLQGDYRRWLLSDEYRHSFSHAGEKWTAHFKGPSLSYVTAANGEPITIGNMSQAMLAAAELTRK